MSEKVKVTVIGCGVLGLSAAIRLQEEGFDVSVFGRDLPTDIHSTAFASPWAGANWHSFAKKTDLQLQRWERETFTKLRAMNNPLIMDLEGIDYFETRDMLDEHVWFDDFLEGYAELPASEVPKGYACGIKYMTLTLDAPQYLQYLGKRLTDSGVPITRQTFQSIEHAFRAVPGTKLVVNATGLGAKSMIGVEDDLVEPIKGQTVLVKAPNAKRTISQLANKDNSTYIIPRPNGTVICGGCFHVGSWDVSSSPELAKQILEKCYELDPALSDGKGPEAIEIVSHNVGLRPSRKGGARLEKEMIELPLKSRVKPALPESEAQTVPVIHCYGIGPAGYQCSWSMAEDVLQLAQNHFQA